VRREADPLTVDESNAGGADRAGERQAGDLRGRRRSVDREDVVRGVRVEGQDRDDDLDLVAQALLEQGAQRPVDQAAGEDRVLTRTAFAAEERSRDTAGGVHPLFDVDRQREEVELLLGMLAGRGGRQQHRVVVEVRRDTAGGLTGEESGLEPDLAGAESSVVNDGFDGGDVTHACPFRRPRPAGGEGRGGTANVVRGAVFDRGPREVSRKPLPRTVYRLVPKWLVTEVDMKL
jgi:hypothetical protein